MAKSGIRIGIVGGTGYTGVELLRLLAQHPDCELAAITSRKEAGTGVAEMFPSLRGRLSLRFSDPDKAGLKDCDLVFFATPNGVAMGEARALVDEGVRVIDIAADFRLRDDSLGKKAGPGGKDLGADVDRVGPGKAYEEWKKTDDYKAWRKQVEDLMAQQ